MEVGFTELRTPEAVAEAFENNDGPMLLVVNSVCGCAAGNARPGVIQALNKMENKPSKMVTVFAGQDAGATAKAREYMTNHPPSSPAIVIFEGKDVVHMIARQDIEGSSAEEVAGYVTEGLNKQAA